MFNIDLSREFQDALLDAQSWPRNAIIKTIGTYPKTLAKLQSRLGDIKQELFEDCPSEWEVPIRDLDAGSETTVDKCNVHDQARLLEWFGLAYTAKVGNVPMDSVVAAKKDPKCRFICIYGRHSRSKLKLSREMFACIMAFHQVMPAFLDFVSVFGQRSEPTDLRFSAFREQVVLSVVNGNLEIQQRFKALTDKNARPQDKSFGMPEECFRSSLSAHLMYCHWSAEDWRWHISWLERAVDKESIMPVLGPSGLGHAHKTYTPQDIQDLQIWEEKAR
ncbi:Uu.00g021060.m01.CDS01 [Anthostomella pinea]|uniref:Uu.00g021060.m01.CDS01 n=1 Tax=Anthostomella pinea TaxID=933095 RepID=A0AAI8VZM4_9PEZI|nr:Uu.00g021060.m01.CDS01 [Anthostomella pinea]